MAVRGWIAVALSTLIAGFWAFWGIIENFHEGWYYRSFAKNIGLMFVQYLLPSVVFVAAAIIAIYWPRIGALLHVTAAITAASFFRRGTGPMIIIIPLLVIAACYWFGRVRPRRRAIAIVVGVPLLVILIAGAEPALRIDGTEHRPQCASARMESI